MMVLGEYLEREALVYSVGVKCAIGTQQFLTATTEDENSNEYYHNNRSDAGSSNCCDADVAAGGLGRGE